MTAPVLSVSGLSKTYGPLAAIDSLDLSVEPGELIALIGHNGAGKTTLLDLVAGLLEPTQGEVMVTGAPAGSLEARRALSYVPDTPSLFEDLSLIEHARYVAGLHGVDDWEAEATELTTRLHLDARADDLPTQFSRGLRQKASLLLALIRPFQVLIVDEPMVGLDAPGRATFMELVNEATERDAAVLVSTHQLDFLESASRCVALRDGALIYDGPAMGLDAYGLIAGADG